jgi:hypothetical protein
MLEGIGNLLPLTGAPLFRKELGLIHFNFTFWTPFPHKAVNPFVSAVDSHTAAARDRLSQNLSANLLERMSGLNANVLELFKWIEGHIRS